MTAPVYGTLGIPNGGNFPGYRSTVCSFYDASRRSFHLATGTTGETLNVKFGSDIAGYGGEIFGDVWRYNTTDSQWTWISGPAGFPSGDPYTYPALGMEEARQPAPQFRAGPTCYYNASTSTLFLAGGYVSYGSASDIWKLNIDSLNWSFIGGKNITGLSPVFGARGIEATTNSMGSFYPSSMFQLNSRLYVHFGATGN